MPLRKLGLAIPILALLVVTAAGTGPRRQAAAVTISLTPAGVTVTPDRVVVRRGETVQWTSEYPFAIAVERNAALFGEALPPQALRGRANAPVRAAVGANAPDGTYKYSVAVWDGENVWVVDPEVVVGPDR